MRCLSAAQKQFARPLRRTRGRPPGAAPPGSAPGPGASFHQLLHFADSTTALPLNTTLLPRWLPAPPSLGNLPARSWSPAALAFLGDSVWELYSRRRFFSPARLHATYVAQVSQCTRAEAQAAVVAALLGGGRLTAEEAAVVKWGRNAQTGKVPERLRAAGAIYREATSLEVLLGFLYVTDAARLEELMAIVGWDDVSPPPGAADHGMGPGIVGQVPLENAWPTEVDA